MRKFITLILAGFFGLLVFGQTPVSAQHVEVCLHDTGDGAGGTLTLRYIPTRDFTSGADALWTSQVVTFRYPASTDLTFPDAGLTIEFGVGVDGLTPWATGGALDGGYRYITVSNSGSFFPKAIFSGDTTDIFRINYTINSGGPAAFELITGNTWTFNNNADVLVQNLGETIYVPGGNAFNSFVNCGNPLFPVEILTFKGKKVTKGVELEWVTTTEINNDFFQVQRSYDGMAFEGIGEVKGAGTSMDVHTYTFLDDTYASNKLYYRLKQVDFDGSFSYSSIVEIRFDTPDKIRMELFPNPADAFVNVAIVNHTPGTEYSVRLFDLAGREIAVKPMDPVTGTVQLEVSTLATGIYAVELIDADGNGLGQSKLFKE